ncbi:hypothetical protein [Paenibacillus sp. FSL K6-2524]|uniref:hypothetical protein n=1 Tax=Paenibacillus sp. FSL K6-2524 TaxID=2954516 RepID=UPI0030FC8D25
MRYKDDLAKGYVNGYYVGQSEGSRLVDGLAPNANDGLGNVRSFEHVGTVTQDGSTPNSPVPADLVSWKATGEEGPHEGVVYVQYELLDVDDNVIPLDEDNLTYITRDGKELKPDADSTLWFNKSLPHGRYVFEIKTAVNVIHVAPLDWRG